MLPALQSLIAVQALDTAAEMARRRLAELPVEKKQVDDRVAEAAATVETRKAQLVANQEARRELEKQVAVIDGRLARFDDHKAAVKTNQEFTALLHEIETAKAGKDALEDQILGLMEEADSLGAAVAEAEGALRKAREQGEAAERAFSVESRDLESEITRLAANRQAALAAIDQPLVTRYEQLLKQRRMIAVAPLEGDVCSGCHVKLRPMVAQRVVRNDEIVTCDSCQRIVYAPPRPADAAAEAPA